LSGAPFSLRPAALWRWLDSADALRRARWLVPLGLGLLSMLLGQDDNWDLRNYHLYNPFALLHGKVGLDLAPAQWQSYFNPTLDLLYYGLIMHLPGPLVGFIMGALQGCNFVLLLALCQRLLPAGADGGPLRRPALLLALAGIAGPGFLSELGNTMGDNLTALFVLGGLLVLLRRWPDLCRPGARGALALLLAGLLLGLGAGLKLTNAPYALALCLALLALDAGWWWRLRAALLFGIGTLAGIAISAGHWYWRMLTVFGNPLFPQFNDRFHGPLALPIGVGDAGWLPHNALEKWLWPFVMTLHPLRTSEIGLRHLLLPLLYLGFAVVALLALARGLRALRGGAMPAPVPGRGPQARLLLIFTALAYGMWLHLFSIYRYLLPLELLAPLLFWLLVLQLPPWPRLRRAGVGLLALGACSFCFVGAWGHSGRWAWRPYDVQVPVLADPAQAMVLMVTPLQSWMVPFFPDTLAFVALDMGFPQSPAYAERVQAMLRQRRGPLMVMLAPAEPPADARRTAAMRERDLQQGREALQSAAATLAKYGMALDGGACTGYLARSGRYQQAYRLCPVQLAR